MPRIRCNYEGCIHLEGNLCTAGEIELDQELGCLTFSQVDEEEVGVAVDEELVDEEWEDVLDEEEEEDEDWEDLEDEDEDEDEEDEW
jgi:DNA-directed RNA polymerase subunit delta